jgi:2,3-bisphosphoglycerate-independent phosphoglycerate mutase
MRVLVVFLDGVGIGNADPDANPFVRARLDAITALIGSKSKLFEPLRHQTERSTMVPLEATLGVPGSPQSGTGQTALFTGINAAKEFGRHFGPWVPTTLRARLATENFLTIAKAAGKTTAFANAYPEELFDRDHARTRDRIRSRDRDRARDPAPDPLTAGPPIAALGAGLLTRHTSHLMRGDAIASEITNDGWRIHLGRTELPIITAQQAGQNLARIAAQHDLTLFAHYSTDYVGHRGDMAEAVAALEKVDVFLGGLAGAITSDTLVVVASDHGNIEDVARGHTLNPALGLFFGDEHARAADGVTSLLDVAPKLLALLGV